MWCGFGSVRQTILLWLLVQQHQLLAQVAPSAVQLTSVGLAAAEGSNGSAATSNSDAACQDVVERGAVAHWEGFESICYDLLYNQVLPRYSRLSSRTLDHYLSGR